MNIGKAILAAASIAILGTTPATADEQFDFDLGDTRTQENTVRLNGFIETRNQRFLESRTDDLTDYLSTSQRLHLEAKYEKGPLTFFVSGFGELDNAKKKYRDDLTYGEVLEAYVTYDGGKTQVTAGRQRIAWGTTDGRSTIDQLNVTDFRDPIGNARTPSKRTSWAVRAQHSFDWGVVEGVLLPVGREIRLPEAGNPWESSDLANLRAGANMGLYTLRIDDVDSAEGGIKITKYGQGFDVSAAYYNGHSDFPVVVKMVPGLTRLEHQDIEIFNLSGAIAPKGLGTFRGEIALTPDLPFGLGQYGDLKQAIVGWDQTYNGSFYVNVQLFGDWIEGMDNNYGATFAISDIFLDESLTLGTRGQIASKSQRTLEAYADYQYSDALTFTARVMRFSGDQGTINGDFDDNDFAELTARFSF